MLLLGLTEFGNAMDNIRALVTKAAAAQSVIDAFPVHRHNFLRQLYDDGTGVLDWTAEPYVPSMGPPVVGKKLEPDESKQDVSGKGLMRTWKVADDEAAGGREWMNQHISRLYQDTVSLIYQPHLFNSVLGNKQESTSRSQGAESRKYDIAGEDLVITEQEY